MPKIEESMVKRFTFLFFHWNRKSRVDDNAIISSLAFTLQTCHPTHFAPPYPTDISVSRPIIIAEHRLFKTLKAFLGPQKAKWYN